MLSEYTVLVTTVFFFPRLFWQNILHGNPCRIFLHFRCTKLVPRKALKLGFYCISEIKYLSVALITCNQQLPVAWFVSDNWEVQNFLLKMAMLKLRRLTAEFLLILELRMIPGCREVFFVKKWQLYVTSVKLFEVSFVKKWKLYVTSVKLFV